MATPPTLHRLIADMALANRTLGKERIAADLRLKLGLTVSPRTVRRDMPRRAQRPGGRLTCLRRPRNHARGVLACDFFLVVTAMLRRLYVCVLIETATRKACTGT